MTAAVLTVGTELTRGELVDTNKAWLAGELTSLGFDVVELASVDDHIDRIVDALKRLSTCAKVVLVTGGLGPTTDDLTAEAVAKALQVPLVRDPGALQELERRFVSLGRPLTDSNRKQADVPAGAEVLGNPVGTAPAFSVHLNGARCFFLPGVPKEMKYLFGELITPRIAPMASANSYQLLLRTYGLPESLVGDRLAELQQQIPGLTLGYRATYPEVEVKVLVRGADRASARPVAERAASEVRARLGDYVYGEDHDTFAAAVGKALRARGYTLAVAESCTGGLVGALLTAVPGSSDYLLVDAVTYSNAAKVQVLGVPEEVLRAYGAVSAECVKKMAEGARRISGASLAVSITGIAGPGGGSEQKPVGLVYFALATERGTRVVEQRFAQGDRARIQRGAAYFALGMVRDACQGPVEVPLAPRCG